MHLKCRVIEGVQSAGEGEESGGWFIPQMAVVIGAPSGQNQEPILHPGFLYQFQEYKYWVIFGFPLSTLTGSCSRSRAIRTQAESSIMVHRHRKQCLKLLLHSGSCYFYLTLMYLRQPTNAWGIG